LEETDSSTRKASREASQAIRHTPYYWAATAVDNHTIEPCPHFLDWLHRIDISGPKVFEEGLSRTLDEED
jgi:hypothetical protein